MPIIFVHTVVYNYNSCVFQLIKYFKRGFWRHNTSVSAEWIQLFIDWINLINTWCLNGVLNMVSSIIYNQNEEHIKSIKRGLNGKRIIYNNSTYASSFTIWFLLIFLILFYLFLLFYFKNDNLFYMHHWSTNYFYYWYIFIILHIYNLLEWSYKFTYIHREEEK